MGNENDVSVKFYAKSNIVCILIKQNLTIN